jgi:hypothetical protein
MPDRWPPILLLLLLLVAVTARGQEEAALAGELEGLLENGNLREALALWEENGEAVKGNVDASLRAGRAWTKHGVLPAAPREGVGVRCAEKAQECLFAADSSVADDDLVRRFRCAAALIDLSDLWDLRDSPEAAGTVRERADAHLQALAAGSCPDEKTALRWGALCRRLAEAWEAALARNPRDRKVKRALPSAWDRAASVLAGGCERNGKNLALTTAYNECLWELLRVREGKVDREPVMDPFSAGLEGSGIDSGGTPFEYRQLLLSLPRSSGWGRPSYTLDDWISGKQRSTDFEAFKEDPEEGRVLALFVEQYLWSQDYRDPLTGKIYDGENISALADQDEADVRALFIDIKERKPLRKTKLNRHIPKAMAYSIKGLADGNIAVEWRSIFFKDREGLQTWNVVVIARLGFLDRNPYELQAVLDSIRFPEKR